MKLSNIYVCDFETVTPQTNFFKQYNKTKVLLYCLKKLKGSFEVLGTSIEDWYNDLLKLNKDILLFFHNLNFDGEFIISWLDNNNWKFINHGDKPIPKTFFMFRQNNQIYKIIMNLENGKECLIHCSLKYLSCSIEALGKDLKISKFEGDEDHSFYDLEPQTHIYQYPKKFVDYCKRDTLILQKSLLNFFANLNGLEKNYWWIHRINLKKYFTIGSIAYKLQNDFIKKFGLEVHYNFFNEIKISKETYDLASNFYFGGITQFNPKYQYKLIECPNGIGLDVNSQHPNSMCNLLPYGELTNFKDKKPPKGIKFLEYWEIDVKHAISKTGDVLNLWNWNREKGHRYMHTMHNFKCFYLKEEWETLQKFYLFEGVRVKNKWWAKADYFLKDYIETLYKFKSDYSAKGEKANAQTYKTLLNSSYGKHATRADFSELYALPDKETYQAILNTTITINKKEYQVKEASDLVKLKNTYVVSLHPTKTKDKLFNKLIAATITAWSRIYLYETIYKLGVENFLYCDTDSIYLKDYKNLDCIEIHPTKLGAWGIIEKFKKFIVKGAKAYVYQSEKGPKYTHSGISKTWLAKNFEIGIFETEEILLKEANLRKKKVEGGVILEWADYLAKPRTT